jgi:hypothetical protein
MQDLSFLQKANIFTYRKKNEYDKSLKLMYATSWLENIIFCLKHNKVKKFSLLRRYRIEIVK